VVDSAGTLYGTTFAGGSGTDCRGGCGAVFELQRAGDGWKEQVLYSFLGGTDGASPQAGVVFDKSGNLYGTTTSGGGPYNDGTVFKLAPNSKGGWTESVLFSFDLQEHPASNLVFDAQGNLYGTAPAGVRGSCVFDDGCGAVFHLKPQTTGPWIETNLHVFSGPPDGGGPTSGVVFDSAGNLYGMTKYGGKGSCRPLSNYFGIQGCGTIYELTPNQDGTWTETILYNFIQGGGSGIFPTGPLSWDSDRLLGLTTAGGDGWGTVFELGQSQKEGWQRNSIHIFFGNPGDGVTPSGRIATSADGDLFGITTTETRRACTPGHCGSVYELRHVQDHWEEHLLHRFRGGESGIPQGGLVIGAQGELYGTTSQGGAGTACEGGCGTVYQINP
jgi:uncharacterized repeat protein (TIGR03803 family)